MTKDIFFTKTPENMYTNPPLPLSLSVSVCPYKYSNTYYCCDDYPCVTAVNTSPFPTLSVPIVQSVPTYLWQKFKKFMLRMSTRQR